MTYLYTWFLIVTAYSQHIEYYRLRFKEVMFVMTDGQQIENPKQY